jgi:hypothetical protein
MRILKAFTLVAVFLFSLVPCGALFAVEYNFMISPPPIPWFEFQEGQYDMRVGATYFNMSGDVEYDGEEQSLKINGGAGSMIARYAFHDQWAIDGGFSFIGGGGSAGPADIGLAGFSIPVDLEFQPVKTEKVCLLLFGGLTYSFVWTGIWYTDSGGTDYEIQAYANQFGPQLGAQLSFKAESIAVAPFFLWQRLSGSASADFYQDGSLVSSGSASLPATTMVFYGLDIVFVPVNLTLSTVLQQIMASGENKGIRTIIISLSYDFQWGIEEKK